MRKRTINIDIIKADASIVKDVSVCIDMAKDQSCLIEIIIAPDLKKKFVAGDFFTALNQLRKWLYKWKGYYPVLNGALENVYPSRMSRQMSKGIKAYSLTMGKQAEEKDLIDIFQKVQKKDIDRLTTVEKQKDYYIDWLKSL